MQLRSFHYVSEHPVIKDLNQLAYRIASCLFSAPASSQLLTPHSTSSHAHSLYLHVVLFPFSNVYLAPTQPLVMLGKGSRFFDHLKRTSTSRPTGRTGQDANQGQSSVNQGPGPPTSVLAATPIPKAAPSPEPSAPTTVPQQIWNEALARLQDFKDGKQAHSVIFEKLANHAGSQEEGDVSQYAADVCERLCSIRDAQSRHSSRGIYEKVIGILDRFIVFEDTGVMLPWAAVRFVLIVSYHHPKSRLQNLSDTNLASESDGWSLTR